jgi:hypothetical protein
MAARRALTVRVVRVVLALAVASSACASSVSFSGGVYRDAHVAFQIGAIPTGWRSIDVSDANVAFRDDAHDASILVNGRCIPDDADAPLASLTAHLIIGTTARQFLVEETIPMDAREARHTVLQAKLDGVLMAYDIFVLKKDGCVYDLVYVGVPEDVRAGAPEFERLARGFRTVARGDT